MEGEREEMWREREEMEREREEMEREERLVTQSAQCSHALG